jgi:hypothetical protein
MDVTRDRLPATASEPTAQETHYARLAARALQSEEASAPSISFGDRAAEVAAIERSLRARGRTRLRSLLAVAGVAAAVAAAVVLGVRAGEAWCSKLRNGPPSQNPQTMTTK